MTPEQYPQWAGAGVLTESNSGRGKGAMNTAVGYQAALAEDARYRLLVDAITDYAIYMLDPAGNIASWNPGAQRLKGYVTNEIVGKHFSIFYTAEDRDAGLPEHGLELSAATGTFSSEGWRVRKDGSRFWAYVVIDPIRNDIGTLVGYAKITRDLTERKLAEAATARNEAQFALLVNSVSDYAIYQLDTEGLIISWNTGAQKIKGYKSHEVIGRSFALFFTEDDRTNRMPARALEIAARDDSFSAEGWRVRKSGDVFWASVTMTAIRDQTGTLLGFAKVTRDLTEAKRAEFVAEAARDALLQAQKIEAIGHLTGGVAHDFNNLLTVILGGLEVIQRRLPEDQNITPLLENAVQAALRGKMLTQRMLAFARRQDLKPEAVELPALLDGMVDLLQRTLGPSVTIETDFPSQLAAVIADPNQLELAILNLAMNARDAMPYGGKIMISAKQGPGIWDRSGLTEEVEYIRVSVTDCGEGMDPGTLQRATEPFFTTKEVGKGTGLGLSMVHGFAEQSNGHFFLKSQPGKGTVAEIWLPTAFAQNDQATCRTAPDASTGSDQDRKVTPVVLAVDDDRLALMNTAAMLNDLGYRVYSATSGKQALAIIRKEVVPDCVIVDHTMPDMNGLDLVEAIKNDWPAIRIIFATPLADSAIEMVPKQALQQHLAAAIAREE
jgi:PAS domain S-box-containing protein